MPLQNRVTPFGDIVALPGRGLMMGNRGILHNEYRRIVRSSQGRRWITCLLSFRGIQRVLMKPHSYTELFFLDEATALSAGHRPCAECRRDAYRRFCSLWEACHDVEASADLIDAKLHVERGSSRKKLTYREDTSNLPDGTYIVLDQKAWLVLGRELLAWSDAGYTERRARPALRDVEVLTPPSTVSVLRAGYRPEVHPSAKFPNIGR